MPNTYWDLFWGYFVLWFLVFVLILKVGAELRRLSREISESRK